MSSALRRLSPPYACSLMRQLNLARVSSPYVCSELGADIISTNARKKFLYNGAPSDRQLWAIGMVVVQWTLIEQMVKTDVHSFTNEDDPDDPIRSVFDSTRSMRMRLDQWEELTKERIQQAWQKPMLDLINETRQVQDLRDKIVHGTWGDKEGKTIAPDTHGPFSWGKPGHAFEWKLDYDGILEVALRIDRHHAAMIDFIFKADSNGSQKQDVRASTALRRIQTAPILA